ncbi:hypothetical protein J1778_14810 [Rahnella sp. H11b]|jgi:hypothetical protein|uniref:PXPV repeat-containing protein n=2 Tax=Rahnella bonaserana TaxID=2816248 RepID=A0ABS6LWT6_9GAMM|nr:hypothetical protein [Rahnella bonaserana]MBU9856548.1 hypothetical protein [Rahnella bonaserana]
MKRLLLLMLTAGALMSASSASFAYGYYGHGYYGHGYGHGYYHGGYYRGWYGPDVVIGIPPPVYYGPPAVVYAAPPQPQTYVEKPPAYAYYCQNPAGYYPQVPACPRGWMKVVAGPR